MSITLKNKELVLKIEKAGEKYKGSRFDWNGLVAGASFRGVSLLGAGKAAVSAKTRHLRTRAFTMNSASKMYRVR